MISIRSRTRTARPLPAARPGQYLTLRIQPDDDAAGRCCATTPSPGRPMPATTGSRSSASATASASGYLHTRLAVGDQLDVAAPRGTFILDTTQPPCC